ncbi:hypothetical protein B9G98_01287 [Wickerhamiella sorbophila]|uniref:Sterol regulatory element-binding protein cleavage-activating protein n=1 Tax=Wickerhamiella sorbophila TaxID=45607 RepID=A0A2T0FFC3_9ASCO|nr:hypothetical protein B9G98_01287 [Wickerhamiella sorbophila]PRT53667.1 hypothetical protein B9G98_01287 [Wickerhamiella sorbophila]
MPCRVAAKAARRVSTILNLLTEYYCSEIPKHLPLLILTPLVYVLVVFYRFYQSFGQRPPTKLLTYESTQEAEPDKVVYIRQVAVIPPVFHRTTDKQMEAFLSPVSEFAATLTNNSTQYPMLLNSTETDDLFPECEHSQCLSFAYLYTDPADEDRFFANLQEITKGPLPPVQHFLFDRPELPHATIPNWTDAPFRLWPTDSSLPQVVAALSLVLVIIEWIRHWLSPTIRYRRLIFGVLVARIAMAITAAVSIASMIFQEFCFSIVKSFLIVPIFLGTVSLVSSSRFLDKLPQGSVESLNPLVRLTMAANRTSSTSVSYQLIAGQILCVLGLFPIFGVPPYLCPVVFVYGYALILDFILHFMLFLPVLYIDLVYQDSHSYNALDSIQMGLATTNESDKQCRVPFLSKIVREVIYCGLALDGILRRGRTLFMLVALMHGVLAYYLLFKGGSLLNGFQPSIRKATKLPQYIELFLSPENEFLKSFTYLDVHSPLIISVRRGFMRPVAETKLVFGSLRYGNTWSIFFEIAALAVFIVSIGMIGYMIFVPKGSLDLKYYLPAREKLYISNVEATHELDICLMETCGNYVGAISWDRRLTIADTSSLQNDMHSWSKSGSAITLPLPSYVWPVKTLIINPAFNLIALFYGHCIEVWNWRVKEMVFHFQHDMSLAELPLAMFFLKDSLIFVTPSGKVVELYSKGQANVVHVLKDCRLKIVSKVSSAKSAHVLLLLIDCDNRVFKARRNVAGEWETEQLDIYESMLAVNAHCINTELPISNGSVQKNLQVSNNPYNVPWTQPSVRDESFKEVVAMPDIELVLLVSDVRVGFFDINTGLFLRYIQIGNHVPNSIRALHSQPTHCAFCGCPAVLSISVAYFDADEPNTLVCHTYQLRDRHRNDICLRVERDPRETRCLGLMSTMEQCHWLENIEVWEASEINSILGIRRRPDSDVSDEAETIELRNQDYTGSLNMMRSLRNRGESLSPLHSGHHHCDYEAFALSANGKLTCSEICFDSQAQGASQLLEDKISAVGKVGTRSVCIGVGNTLKVLGLAQAQI